MGRGWFRDSRRTCQQARRARALHPVHSDPSGSAGREASQHSPKGRSRALPAGLDVHGLRLLLLRTALLNLRSNPLRARQIDQEVPKTPIFVLFLLSHRH